MKCSICIATYNKADALNNTLGSIFRQAPPFDTEIIVVDDGSTDHTEKVCESHGVRYVKLNDSTGYRNPAVARNISYRMASGDVIIAQSDDVKHHTENTVELLIDKLFPGHFVIATVLNVGGRKAGYGGQLNYYTGPRKQRPLFFLGSLYREDLYLVGGNDEEFKSPGREDVWFGECLTRGLKLSPIYTDEIVGHHQAHDHCAYADTFDSRVLFDKKIQKGVWKSSGGSWI